MTRKFLFCFPLRLGNMVFGYFVLIISIAVVAYNLYQLGLTIQSPLKAEDDSRFKNWEKLEELFGEKNESLVSIVTMVYYISYIVVAFLMFIAAAIFTCGAYSVNSCLVSLFFVYSFFHLFLTIILIVWEATSGGWVQLGLILGSDYSRPALITRWFGLCYRLHASLVYLHWGLHTQRSVPHDDFFNEKLSVILMICLFSVKYLMDAIRTGNIYCRPGEVYYKY